MRVSLIKKASVAWLLFSTVQYDETTGIEVDGSKRVGFKEVQLEKADTALKYAQSKEWTLSEEPDANGYHTVSEVKQPAEGELKQTVKNGKQPEMAKS